jgi:hypothetical protein
VIPLLQSVRIAFALVSGALLFMMMSLRQGKISESIESLKQTNVGCFCQIMSISTLEDLLAICQPATFNVVFVSTHQCLLKKTPLGCNAGGTRFDPKISQWRTGSIKNQSPQIYSLALVLVPLGLFVQNVLDLLPWYYFVCNFINMGMFRFRSQST